VSLYSPDTDIAGQGELKEVMHNLAKMEKTLAESTERKQQLEAEVKLCSEKLDRSATLIGGLGGEKVRPGTATWPGG
jgi:dynein heavy chain, axonemal